MSYDVADPRTQQISRQIFAAAVAALIPWEHRMKLRELKELMDTSRGGEPTANLIPFRVERSEFTAQLNFVTPYWPIAQNISLLYSGLLNRMRDFGVTSQGIRTDTADGSLGAFNVNFWMLQFAVIVRIRLDYLELNAPHFAVDADQLERAYLALDQSLRDGQKDLSYSSYVVTFGMHGRLDGIEAKQFLARFTDNVPEGLGSPLGSGTVFYYEGGPPTTLLSVTASLVGQRLGLHRSLTPSISSNSGRQGALNTFRQ